LLSDSYKEVNSTEDPKLKKRYERIIKKTEKHLTELENKTPKVIDFYERTKKRLDLLR
jgi:hypothetical protein